jgi:hypothetical protein
MRGQPKGEQKCVRTLQSSAVWEISSKSFDVNGSVEGGERGVKLV